MDYGEIENGKGEEGRKGRMCLLQKKSQHSRRKKITSGAIQYGLPLNESIEEEAFIWVTTIKSQRRSIIY